MTTLILDGTSGKPVRSHKEHNPVADTSRKVLSRLPASLVRDLSRVGRGSDRALRLAAEHCGAPRLDAILMGSIFAPESAGQTLLREQRVRQERYAREHGSGAVDGNTIDNARAVGAFATGRQGYAIGAAERLSLMPGLSFTPGDPTYGMGASPPPPMQEQPRVLRIPYCLYQETVLAAGDNVVTSAANAGYVNGTGKRWMVTHVHLSQGREPVVLPAYRLKITPNNPGKSWTKNHMPAVNYLSYVPFGPIQNTPITPFVKWTLDGVYTLPANASLYAEGTNNGSVAITLSICAIGYKRDSLGTPRFLQDAIEIAAGAANQNFNPTNLTGDGDADLDITDITFTTTGSTTWGIANPTSPLVLLRPNGVTGDQTTWTGLNPVSVIHLNTGGTQGAYLKLATPVYVPPGTTLSVEFQNTGAGTPRANCSFLGYLETTGGGGY